MSLYTYDLAKVIHEERIAAAAQARLWAEYSVSEPLRDRLRRALSDRLMQWIARPASATIPTKARV